MKEWLHLFEKNVFLSRKQNAQKLRRPRNFVPAFLKYKKNI
jgi:hypothetical protein